MRSTKRLISVPSEPQLEKRPIGKRATDGPKPPHPRDTLGIVPTPEVCRALRHVIAEHTGMKRSERPSGPSVKQMAGWTLLLMGLMVAGVIYNAPKREAPAEVKTYSLEKQP